MYYRWSFTLEFSLDLHVYQGLIQAYYYPYTKLYSFNLVLVSLPLFLTVAGLMGWVITSWRAYVHLKKREWIYAELAS